MEGTVDLAATIRDEVTALCDLYGVTDFPPPAVLDSPLLRQYVEIVLCADQLELVLGGVGRVAEVSALATEHGVHPEAVAALQAFGRHCPDKMFYVKLCQEQHRSSVYLVVLAPWDTLWEVFLQLGFRDEVLGAVKENVAGHTLCFMLAFNYREDLGGLQVKAYHLADRDEGSSAKQPFLLSWRFGRAALDPDPKVYAGREDWGDFRGVPGFAAVAALGERLFGDRHEIVKGTGGDGKVKCYVFRHDVRESASYSLKRYNYYFEEGYQLTKLSAFAEAERAFRNALRFEPHNVDAQNHLGYVILMQGRYLEGIRRVREAQAKNPRLCNLIWQWVNPALGQEAEIARLSALIETDPQPRWYHERGVHYFNTRDYHRAKADLQKALELQPMAAEAYNDLSGTLIQLGEFVQAVKRCILAQSINRQLNPANLSIARTALKLLRETEQKPSVQSFLALGKFYYQLDMFEKAERCFVESERLGRVEAEPRVAASA